MADWPSRSFAVHLAFAFAAAAVLLMLLIGTASTLYTLQLYARTTNEVIASAARTVEGRVARYEMTHVSTARYAASLTADLGRPRVRIAVFNNNHRLVSESAPLRPATGVTGAVASLMSLRAVEIPITGGFVSVSANVDQVGDALRGYYRLMVPVCVVAIVLAWIAGWLIARRAVAPLRDISAAMRRLAQGDFGAEPLRATSNDEIGELAHAYNGAVQHLHSASAQRDRGEAEIRQFIANAGHELRTPLTVIMGYLDTLEDGAADAPGVRERVFATLHQESRRMRLLIEKLIYLARLERGEPAILEVVDLATVALNVALSVAPVDAAAIELATAPGATVLADPGEIAEAVRNLVENALKYAPGSPVRISTEVQAANAVIEVRDWGPGIPGYECDHVFERFYRGRAHRDLEGTGLGLAIVQRAVRRYGGTIALESRMGEGTTFIIRLPRATPS